MALSGVLLPISLALLGMKWWCWHFVLNRCIGCIWLQAWAFPLWKIRLCFKPPHSETLLIHFSRYSCWCKQNRWSLNHKDMALRRKGGETHGRPPAPLDIKFEISCSNGGCVGRVSIWLSSLLQDAFWTRKNIHALFDFGWGRFRMFFVIWMWTYWITLYLSAGISWDKGQKVELFFLEPTITGLATKTIPRFAPLRTEHSKNYNIAWDWLKSPSEHLLHLQHPTYAIFCLFYENCVFDPGTITEHSKKYDSAWDWLQSPSEHLLYLQHPTYAKCLPFLRKLPFWSRNNYFCSPDIFLLSRQIPVFVLQLKRRFLPNTLFRLSLNDVFSLQRRIFHYNIYI